MIPFWTLIILIAVFAISLTLLLKLVLKKIAYFQRYKTLVAWSVFIGAGLYMYCTYACTQICVVTSLTETERYTLLTSAEYTFNTGKKIQLTPTYNTSTNWVINNISQPVHFELIGYSKDGNNSIEYGNVEIEPEGIETISQYPDFTFSDPPETINVRSAALSSVTIKGWLHL